jgi:exodeoxyribonuclease VII small subunit
MPKKKSDLDFAAGFKELEDIAHWFERGEPDLEQGLQKFTRASELAKALRERLIEVENVIKEVRG